jgi:hypothetical protein
VFVQHELKRRSSKELEQGSGAPEVLRIFELETENQQLTRLVADLLLKNRRLRWGGELTVCGLGWAHRTCLQ